MIGTFQGMLHRFDGRNANAQALFLFYAETNQP
jgi:hypothetical protein